LLFLFAGKCAILGSMMIRALSLSVLLLVAVPVQAAQDSKTIEIAPEAPVDPVKKRAQDIDKLFGELHKGSSTNPRATIEKIVTIVQWPKFC
jgi:competence protein ComGC